MKILLLMLTVFLLNENSNAQIPNAGFEFWTNGMPDNWITNNGTGFITADSNAYDGFLAARLQPFSNAGTSTTSTFFTRIVNNSSYYHVSPSTPPTFVEFRAITNLQNGDVLTFNTTMTSGGTIVAVINATCISTNSSTYQYYSFPFGYLTPGAIPDSSATWFSIKHGGCIGTNQVNLNSFAIIDGLSFGFTTSDNESNKNIIQNIFPNPSDNLCTVRYSLEKVSNVQIRLLDFNGKEHANLNYEKQNTGQHLELIDTKNIPNGLYLLTITTASQKYSSKVSISH